MKKLSEKDRRLHQQFSEYGRNAREWMKKCVLLLPEIERNRIWEKKGFHNIYEYSAKLAGMNHDTVVDGLRVLKKVEDKPELLKIVEEKGYRAVKPIACIATKENAGFWAEKARIMSVHTLETYVREVKKNENLMKNGKLIPKDCLTNAEKYRFEKDENQNGLFEPNFGVFERHETAENIDFPQKKAILIFVEPEIAAQLEKLKGQGGWNELMKEYLELRNEKLEKMRLEIESEACEKMEKKQKLFDQKTAQSTQNFIAKPLCRILSTQILSTKNNRDPI